MNAHCLLGCLLLAFTALLVYSQTVAVFHFSDHQVEGFDHLRRHAVQSSIRNYGLALVVLCIAILLLRSSASAVAWAAFVVVVVALWLMVGRELWLHYFELPRKYPRFADARPPYFTGTFWMFTPRFLWHLILPVASVVSALHLFSTTRNGDAKPGAPPNGGPMAPSGTSGVSKGLSSGR